MLWSLSLAILSLVQVPPPLGDADLRVTLSAVKSPITVGEFTKVRAEWVARRQVAVLFGTETILIDAGHGFVEHAEASLREETTITLPTVLAEGGRRVTESILGLAPRHAPPESSGVELLNASVRFVFDHVGTYRVKLRYENVESNEIQVDVVAPAAGDSALLSALSDAPAILSPYGGADGDLVERGEALLNAYGAHVYMIPFIRQRFPSRAQPTFDFRSSLDVRQSAFAADEMLWRAESGAQFFDAHWARAAYAQVIESFPDSAAAEQATEELSELDEARPTLAIVASPAGLWRPDGSMWPVNILLRVTDSIHGAPVVRLTSITCDDGCNAADIDGAAFGTDDRDFRLRAGRTTGGPGRTYTITYTATESNQLETVATTTVLVPHDRRSQ